MHIDALEPEPDASVAYESYLKAKYKSDASLPALEGGTEHLEWVEKYTEAKKYENQWAEIAQGYKNKLIRCLGECDTLEFGKAGKVTYKTNAKGTRTLYVGVKMAG
jgi:hypothetical protein